MFTIRHDQDDGEVRLYTTMQVQFLPMTMKNGDCGGVHMLVSPHEAGPGIACGTLRGGTAYVMNQFGRTVATFEMRGKPTQPADYDPPEDVSPLKKAA
jgi:hypothetical protein